MLPQAPMGPSNQQHFVQSQAPVGDGLQSMQLREKLKQLEQEIEKFRVANQDLATQRREREQVRYRNVFLWSRSRCGN